MSIASTSSSRRAALLGLAAACAVACGGSKRRAADDPLGLPSLDHAWTVDELERAATIIDATCTRAPTQLPAYGSPAFVHLVDAGNRTTIPDGPVETRQAALTRYTGATLRLYDTYLRCGRPAETLAANAALLEGYAEALIVGEAMRDDALDGSPERAQRQHGLDTMTGGLVGGITATINMLVDPTIPGPLPPDVTARLGAAIAAVRHELPDHALDEAVAPLARAVSAELDPDRRQALAAAARAMSLAAAPVEVAPPQPPLSPEETERRAGKPTGLAPDQAAAVITEALIEGLATGRASLTSVIDSSGGLVEVVIDARGKPRAKHLCGGDARDLAATYLGRAVDRQRGGGGPLVCDNQFVAMAPPTAGDARAALGRHAVCRSPGDGDPADGLVFVAGPDGALRLRGVLALTAGHPVTALAPALAAALARGRCR